MVQLNVQAPEVQPVRRDPRLGATSGNSVGAFSQALASFAPQLTTAINNEGRRQTAKAQQATTLAGAQAFLDLTGIQLDAVQAELGEVSTLSVDPGIAAEMSEDFLAPVSAAEQELLRLKRANLQRNGREIGTNIKMVTRIRELIEADPLRAPEYCRVLRDATGKGANQLLEEIQDTLGEPEDTLQKRIDEARIKYGYDAVVPDSIVLERDQQQADAEARRTHWQNQRDLLKARGELSARQEAQGLIDNQVPAMYLRTAEVGRNMIKDGSPPAQLEEQLALVNNEIEQLHLQMPNVRLHGDKALADAVVAPLVYLRDGFEKRISGEITDEMLKRRVSILENEARLKNFEGIEGYAEGYVLMQDFGQYSDDNFQMQEKFRAFLDPVLLTSLGLDSGSNNNFQAILRARNLSVRDIQENLPRTVSMLLRAARDPNKKPEYDEIVLGATQAIIRGIADNENGLDRVQMEAILPLTTEPEVWKNLSVDRNSTIWNKFENMLGAYVGEVSTELFEDVRAIANLGYQVSVNENGEVRFFATDESRRIVSKTPGLRGILDRFPRDYGHVLPHLATLVSDMNGVPKQDAVEAMIEGVNPMQRDISALFEEPRRLTPVQPGEVLMLTGGENGDRVLMNQGDGLVDVTDQSFPIPRDDLLGTEAAER